MSSPPSPPPSHSLATIGIGYAIALALAFLVVLSILLLSSYLCRRRRHHRTLQRAIAANTTTTTTSSSGIMLPSIIFVPEIGNPNRPDSPTGVVGLDDSVIRSYPKFQFFRGNSDSDSTVCSICLCEYREGEMLRMMPDCRHAFHLLCIDAWLRLNGSCPVCRCSPLPTPLSTPLAEVVPLAQFADNRRRRPS